MNLFLVRLPGPGPRGKSYWIEESEIGFLGTTYRVSSHFLGFCLLICHGMQALALLKHRVSEFFSHPTGSNANNE